MAARLPLEIWSDILEWVTYVPGLMSVDVPDPFDSPTTLTPDHPWCLQKLRRSLWQRRMLVLVCRDWHTMAVPILYRCVLVRDPDSAEKLHRTLAASQERGDRPTRGSHARHLILALSERYVFSRTIRYLPKLEILTAPSLEIVSPDTCRTVTAPAPPPARAAQLPPEDSFVRALSDTCGASLRRIQIGQFPSTDDAHAFLRATPHLRTIISRDASLCLNNTLAVLPPVTFMTVHGSLAGGAAAHAPVPSARSVFLRDPGLYRSRDAWARFLATQGAHLARVHIDFAASDYAAFVSAPHGAVAVLERHCPRLAHLILHLARAPHGGAGFALRRVAALAPRLGIHFVEDGPAAAEAARACAPLVAGLLEIDARVPPRVVRFLNAEVAAALRAHMDGAEGVALTQAVLAGRFRLEDADGRYLGPSRPRVDG
ncbi:hypothetical protein BC834DRAFT_840437 [Gloeopeniophorella convolvens]|nr:hypothetical protein BC834DRAFT_840437 [Gloeopeniophorella convolvens]